ncbi:hypothetical protein [Streptomyces sp. NPDC002853]
MSDRLSPQREAEIRNRIPSVYDGPWDYQWDDSEGARYSGWVISYPTDNPLAGLVAEVPDYGEQLADFIAHARTDVPALLAELAAVRAERDEARAEVERLKGQRSFLLKQIQKKDARSGDGDAALRRFLAPTPLEDQAARETDPARRSAMRMILRRPPEDEGAER